MPRTLPTWPTTLWNRLRRHEARRNNDIPTLSVFTGTVQNSIRLWTEWIESLSRQCITVPYVCGCVEDWLQTVLQSDDLQSQLLEFTAERMGISANRLRHDVLAKSTFELQPLFERVYETVPEPTALLFQRRAFAWRGCQPPIDVAIADLIEGVRHLYPEGKSPAVIVAAAGGDDLDALDCEFERLLRHLNRHPWLTCAIAARQEELDCWLPRLSSHAAAVLRDGAIAVERETEVGTDEEADDSDTTVRQRNDESVRSTKPNRVSRAEVKEATAIALAAVEADRRSPRTQDKSDRARSQAERLLFLLLESHEETAGMFQLNVRAGFDFGAKPAELDLACKALKIAVEVDGYYHFTSPDCYRRDRRKDVVLQTNGYLVSRFLAEDVANRSQSVLQAVVSAVQFRKSVTF